MDGQSASDTLVRMQYPEVPTAKVLNPAVGRAFYCFTETISGSQETITEKAIGEIGTEKIS
jgi:hypothetical protein